MRKAVEYLSEIAKKSGAEQFDIIAGKSNSKGISIFNGELKNTEISSSCGIGIRIFKNQKPGYASTEKFSKESLEQTLADAISNSEFTEKMNVELPSSFLLNASSESLNTYNPDLENVAPKQLSDVCLDIEKQILSADEIKNVPDLGAEVYSSTTIFTNSKGIFFTDKRNQFGIGAGAIAERAGVVKMGWYTKSGRDFSKVSAEQISKEVITRAKELLSPKKIQSCKIPVILSKRISANILSIFLSSFYAENAQKGLSKLVNSLGKKIAAEKFSLYSDPLNPELSGSILMDSEGFATSKLCVVENGEFKSFLYNLEAASKENRQSTGNGIRGFAGKAGTTFFNATVPLGNLSATEMLKLFPKCLIINHLEGSSGCKPLSGEISIGAQGFWCEHGEPVHAVDNITISANFFDLIQNIAGIGNEYSDSFSSVKVPTLAITEMSVSA